MNLSSLLNSFASQPSRPFSFLFIPPFFSLVLFIFNHSSYCSCICCSHHSFIYLLSFIRLLSLHLHPLPLASSLLLLRSLRRVLPAFLPLFFQSHTTSTHSHTHSTNVVSLTLSIFVFVLLSSPPPGPWWVCLPPRRVVSPPFQYTCVSHLLNMWVPQVNTQKPRSLDVLTPCHILRLQLRNFISKTCLALSEREIENKKSERKWSAEEKK